MAFPNTPVPVVVELQAGGTWTDITADVYVRNSIQISRGRADEGSRPDPAKCSLTLNNRGGKYSPRNPLSPYYGLIGRNTPIRVSIPWGPTYLQLPGAAGGVASTPDAAALDVTGDIDVRVDCTLSDWYSAFVALISKTSWVGAQRSWELRVTSTGSVRWTWSPDGTIAYGHNTAAGALVLPANRRIALRVTLDVDNGSGGNTATFYSAPSLAGPWTVIGTSTLPFTTSIYNSTTPVWIGDSGEVGLHPAAGRVHGAQIYNGIGGSLVANPDFTVQAPGASTFVDSVGRTWSTAGGSELTNRQTRFRGEVSEWPSRWDVSGRDVWVPVQASGILRRLGQGAAPLASPLRRDYTGQSAARVNVAYWPLEDGRDAEQAASALPAVGPLATVGLTFAEDSSLPGSLALPALGAASSLTGAVLAAATGRWQVDWWLLAGSVTGSDNVLMQWTTTGTAATWRLTLDAGNLRLSAYSASGALLGSSVTNPASLVGGGWYSMKVSATQSGGNIAWTVLWSSIDGTYAWVQSGSVAGTNGNVTGVATQFGAGLAGANIGHLAVRSDVYQMFAGPALGHPGEDAWFRVGRLCQEQGIPYVMGGTVPPDTLVGVQHVDTLLNLLGEAMAADGGTLGEDIELPALSVRSRASRYNQPAALALDYAVEGHVAPPLEPLDDDQHIRNSITVQRAGGSSMPVALTSGPLSTQAPPGGVGLYDEQVTLSLYSDDQLPDIAAWRLYLGTQDVTRYPTVHIDLAAGPALIDQVLALREGDRVTIAHPPSWLPPALIDLIAEGWTETIGVYDWDIVINGSPGGPWRVAQLDDAVLSRLDTGGSQLAAAATSTATSLSVATTVGPVWSPNLVDSPFDLSVAGERVTVLAVGQLLSPDNPLLLAPGTTGWTAQNCTLSRDTSVVHTDAGAVASLKIVPNGAAASGGAGATPLSAPGTVTPGASYTVGMWAYSPGGWSDLRPVIDWYDAAGAFLNTGLGSATAVPAGQWTYLQQNLTAPASASRAVPRARHGGTPPASAIWYEWALRMVPTATVTTTSPQQMTVIRSVNGIAKAQAAGAPVALADTSMILAL